MKYVLAYRFGCFACDMNTSRDYHFILYCLDELFSCYYNIVDVLCVICSDKAKNEPPHIHVQTAEKYAKFWLTPIQLADSFGYNKKELQPFGSLAILEP